MSQPKLPPYKVAFIIDGAVVEVLYAEARLAAILLSEPKMVDVTDMLNEDPHSVHPGTLYDPETNEFTNPVIEA